VRAASLVLSHAHIDHSGNLPSLVKRGFAGNIYCTPPTRDLCSVMLRDSAMIQEADARYLNKRFDTEVEPLYDIDDVQKAIGLMISVPLRRPMPVAPGVTATFFNAGHVLGSALVQLDLAERGKRTRLLFTGDLGRAELPLLEPPDIPEGVDVLLMESTYGDRDHPSIEIADAELEQIVRETVERKGRVYIPTFALERAQEVLFSLERLSERGRLPAIPIYIDSPLAIAITEIYKLHPEGLAADVRERLLGRDDPFSPPGLRYVSDVEASKAIQDSNDPCIVIAGSGMCEGGRILYHFREALGRPENSVVIVGFMAQHTLGRRLVERRPKVKVLGVERELRARVHVINALGPRRRLRSGALRAGARRARQRPQGRAGSRRARRQARARRSARRRRAPGRGRVRARRGRRAVVSCRNTASPRVDSRHRDGSPRAVDC
jgi:metallo-beta-lactamase family protein